MRTVIVEAVEIDGDKALVFGTDQDGAKVAFGLPRESGLEMRALLEAGEVVAAELPDDLGDPARASRGGPGMGRVASHRLVEVRRPRQN